MKKISWTDLVAAKSLKVLQAKERRSRGRNPSTTFSGRRVLVRINRRKFLRDRLRMKDGPSSHQNHTNIMSDSGLKIKKCRI